MRVYFDSNLRTLKSLYAVIVACTTVGCWQEIHYTPTAADKAAHERQKPQTSVRQTTPLTNADASTSPSAAEPVLGESSDEAANSFADDVAAKLAAVKPLVTSPPPEHPSASPIAESDSKASPSGSLPWEELAVSAKPVEAAESPPKPPTNPETSVASAPPNSEPSSAPSTPTPPPQPPSADDPAHSPRRIAWLLGNKLSLSALANDRGGAVDETAKLFSQAETLAEMLDTSVSDLPPARPTASTDSNFDRSLQYLFSQGQPIGRTLATKYGDDHAALFELAVKSNILLALYRPHASWLARSRRQSSRPAGDRVCR